MGWVIKQDLKLCRLQAWAVGGVRRSLTDNNSLKVLSAGLRLGHPFPARPLAGPDGAKALLGEKPQGMIVSDRYAGYNFIDLQQRQVCWAHLLRDFARIANLAGQAGVIGQRLQACGYALFRWRAQTSRPSISSGCSAACTNTCETVLARAQPTPTPTCSRSSRRCGTSSGI
jgi:Transposase IS66 family